MAIGDVMFAAVAIAKNLLFVKCVTVRREPKGTSSKKAPVQAPSTEQQMSPTSPVTQSVPGGAGFSFDQSSSGAGSVFGQSSSEEGFAFSAPPIPARGFVFDAPPADEQEPEPESWHFVTYFAVLM